MSLVEKANQAYYNEKESLLTDTEFDLLADNGLEMTNFRNKTNHYQPMGSLKKIKDEKSFSKWYPEDAIVSCTPKLDGNSIELVVTKGVITKAITRGDGFIGNDVTDKIKFCNIKHVPYIGNPLYSLKCEAIIPKKYQKDYAKHLRNVAGGIINRKTPVVDELKKIDIIPFTELDAKILSGITYAKLEENYAEAKEQFPYDIDGIVLELVQHVHPEKDELLPENIMALKFNKEGIDAVIGDIQWNLGKHSRLTPVLILKEAVEIDGTNVQRVSASNWSLLNEAGLGIGAKIQVIKSGDIIPFVSKVIQKSDDIIYAQCPICSTTGVLNESEVQMICPNSFCKGKELIKLQHIFQVFDLDYISDSTVERLYDAGIDTLEQIFALSEIDLMLIDGFGERKSANIIAKLNNIVLTEAKVLKCAMVQGISESNGQKIIDHYGDISTFLNSRDNKDIDYTCIKGIGEVMSETINANFHLFISTFLSLRDKIIIFQIKKTKLDPTAANLNIVFTGKCTRFSRKELTDVLESKGFTVQKAINKETNILLVADTNSESGKTKKAKSLDVEIKGYDAFFAKVKI